MSLIELDNITFSYDEGEKPVLEDFSLQLQEGKCLIVEGDNGSGKTTLFRILNGLSFPQKGTYLFDGERMDRAFFKDNQRTKSFHKKMGYLFQNPDVMLFNARVYDEVAFGPRQMGLDDPEVDRRTKDMLELFGIAKLSDKAPYHLSGGQKKKVALAAVMALNPEVLVLDEPDAGLDSRSIEWLVSFLGELKTAGKTLVIATHNRDISSALSDEILTM